jgi:hypothetical protein
MEKNPAEALRIAWPADVVADVAAAVPAARGQLESRGVWQGPVEYSVEDGADFTTHRDIRAMSVGGETLFIQFAGVDPRGFKNGDTLRVEGVRAGSQVVAERSSIVGTSGATTSGGASTRVRDFVRAAAWLGDVVVGVIGDAGGRIVRVHLDDEDDSLECGLCDVCGGRDGDKWTICWDGNWQPDGEAGEVILSVRQTSLSVRRAAHYRSGPITCPSGRTESVSDG